MDKTTIKIILAISLMLNIGLVIAYRYIPEKVPVTLSSVDLIEPNDGTKVIGISSRLYRALDSCSQGIVDISYFGDIECYIIIGENRGTYQYEDGGVWVGERSL